MRDLTDKTRWSLGRSPDDRDEGDRRAGKKAPRARTPLFGRVKKLGRLAAFVFVASLGMGLLALRSVYADVENAALALGGELGRLGDVGSARALRLNGQSIHVASVVEDMSVVEVLDAMEQGCRDGNAASVEAFEKLPAAAKKGLPKDASASKAAGVLRKERLGEGVVACLLQDETESTGTAARVARMQRFAATGDLGQLGKLRYVWVRGLDDRRSQVVRAWTDGEFDLYALLPKTGDTPGTDPRDVPRIDGSVRLLTADVEGVPYIVRLYDVPGAPEQVLGKYDADMAQRGWRKVDTDDATPNGRGYARGGVDVMLFADAQDARTLVSMIEMRPR